MSRVGIFIGIFWLLFGYGPGEPTTCRLVTTPSEWPQPPGVAVLYRPSGRQGPTLAHHDTTTPSLVAKSGSSVKDFFEKNLPRFLEPGIIRGSSPDMSHQVELQEMSDLSTEDRGIIRWKDERVVD